LQGSKQECCRSFGEREISGRRGNLLWFADGEAGRGNLKRYGGEWREGIG